jgi:type II secretory pathway component PulF
MSLWIRRKDEDGKTHFFAILFAPWIILIIMAVIGIFLALLLPIFQAIKQWLGG